MSSHEKTIYEIHLANAGFIQPEEPQHYSGDELEEDEEIKEEDDLA